MYKKAKSCVKQFTKVSGIFPCNIGVRQGDNLSPLLFSIFLNDFAVTLSEKCNGLTTLNELTLEYLELFINLYVLLYADDTLVLAESPEELQLAMNETHAYCNKWDLKVNPDKTKVVIFSLGKVKTKYNFKMGNLDIDTDIEYCYLGFVFNFNGKLTKAIENRLTPARKAMFGLNSKAFSLQLPVDIHLELFDKMVLPICLYGSEIWGYGNIEPLEIFYRKFLKRVLGLNKTTPNCAVYGELGKYPVKIHVMQRMISFWIKVSEGKASKLSRIMYNLIFKLHENGSYNSPWLMKIKDLLCHSGNPNFWFHQEHFDSKDFMKKILSQQFRDEYQQEWNFEINRNRKCTIYRIFKHEHSFEQYLIKLNFIERRTLCRFRTGNHKLPIAEARYKTGVDATCKLCLSQDICDEFHVLFQCKFFEEKRKIYLKPFYINRPSTYKMDLLFNSSYRQLSQLAKFCRFITSKFN